MSKNTRLIVTALPYQDATRPNTLCVSVALNPQLLMRGDRVRLGLHYPEVHRWPEYAPVFEHLIQFRLYAFDKADWKDKGRLDIRFTRVASHPSPDSDLGQQLWERMLPADAPISHWQDTGVAFELAEVLTLNRMTELTRLALAEAIDDETTRVDQLPNEAAGSYARRSGAAIDALTSLMNEPLERLLNNPIVTSHPTLLGNLRKLNEGFKEELDQLRLRLDLTEVYERNVRETREFHKRFSAYGQHPALLRRTGWLWEYELDLNSDSAAGIQERIAEWNTADYHIFLAVDAVPFQLSDPADPTVKEYGVFKKSSPPAPIRSYLDQLVPDSDPQRQAFFLGLLNELDVNCTLTAVEPLFGADACPPKAAANQQLNGWRVQSRTQRELVKGPASASTTASDEPLFARFGDYVPVNDTRFAIHAQLVDRKQLFWRIEELVLRSDGSSAATGPQAFEQLSESAERSHATASSTGHSTGFTANGITLVINNLQQLLAEATTYNPAAQRQELTEATVGTSAGIDNSTLANIVKLLSDSVLLYQHNVHQGYRVDVVGCGPPHGLYSTVIPSSQGCFVAGTLCGKRETYEAGSSDLLTVDTEGWVSEPAQLRNDGKLYVEDELFHWNDWNLVVPLDGQPADGDYISDDSSPSLTITSCVASGSMVPLRLLWRYSFALRPVDIAGHSAPPIDQRLRAGGDWADQASRFRAFLNGKLAPGENNCPRIEEVFTPPITYQRVEGVHQPRLLPYRKNPSRWHHGGTTAPDLTTFVIRSFYSATEDNLKREDHDDVRMLAPPRISLMLLLQHGVLDDILFGVSHVVGKDRQELLNELRQLDAVKWYPEDQTAAADPVDDDTTVNYPFDPLVDGFEIILDGIVFPIEVGYAPKTARDRYWRNKRYHRIALRAATDEQQEAEISLRFAVPLGVPPPHRPQETVFALRRGFAHEISLGCRLKETFGGTDTRDVFLRGVAPVYFSPLSKPARWDDPVPTPGGAPVTFVHAVEKPCLLYEKYPGAQPSDFRSTVPCAQVKLPGRQPAQRVQHLYLKFERFPVLTADTFRLHAVTVDVVCDRLSPEGVRLVLTRQVVQSGVQPKRAGFGPTDRVRETNVEFDNLRHTLPDTRHSRVSYEVEAVSKFAHYFADRAADRAAAERAAADHVARNPATRATASKALADLATANARATSVNGYVYETLDALVVPKRKPPLKPTASDYAKWLNDTYFDYQQSQQLLSVLSTAKPVEPVIEKSAPILSWSRQKVGETFTVERRCETIRIYFEGDWYRTGWGEQVAVLFHQRSAADTGWRRGFSSADSVRFSEPGTDYREQSLSQLISQYGTDPISSTRGIGDYIDNGFFVGVRTSGTVRIGDLEWDKPPYTDATVSPFDELQNRELHYVLYDVRFKSAAELNAAAGYASENADKAPFREGKFYVDIRLNDERLKDYYFPFLRLAIARFQANSIRPLVNGKESERYRFSKVVMTDFIQPLPYRKLQVTKDNDGLKILWDAANVSREGSPGKPNRVVYFLKELGQRPENPSVQPDLVTGALHLLDGANNDQEPVADLAKPLAWGKQTTTSMLSSGSGKSVPYVLTIAEYEQHDNDELVAATDTDGVPADTENAQDPRQDPRLRLVFSYVHQEPVL